MTVLLIEDGYFYMREGDNNYSISMTIFGDCNWIGTQNHLVRKRTLNQFDQIVECSFTNLVVLGSSPVAVTYPSDFEHASSKEFLEIQATIKCGSTLKCVRDMTRTYRQFLVITL